MEGEVYRPLKQILTVNYKREQFYLNVSFWLVNGQILLYFLQIIIKMLRFLLSSRYNWTKQNTRVMTTETLNTGLNAYQSRRKCVYKDIYNDK